MKVRIVAAVWIIALLFGGWGGWVSRITKHHEPQRCEEDMACWDCETMGNHLCGPPPCATDTECGAVGRSG